MSFAHPLWFWGLALLPLAVFLQVANDARRAKLVRQLVAPRLETQLAGTASSGKRWLRLLLVLLGLAAIFTTMAQPRWGFQTIEIKTRGRDIILSFGDTVVTSVDDLHALLTDERIGRPEVVTVLRDGVTRTFTVETVGTSP